MQCLDLNPSSFQDNYLAQQSAYDISNNCAGSDPLSFSQVVPKKSNVLLGFYNSLNAEPSPPVTGPCSCSPPESGFMFDNIILNKKQSLFDDVGFPDISCDNMFLPFDEDIQIQGFVTDADCGVFLETYYTPSNYSSSDNYSVLPQPPFAPSASLHAVSLPITIGSSSNNSRYQPADDGADISSIMEHAVPVASCASGNLGDAVMLGSWQYKNKQAIFDEIFRECEHHRYVESEIEIQSTKSVVSIDESYDDNYDAETYDSDEFGDVRGKKKHQNRQAALRYRSKRRSQRAEFGAERQRLEVHNARLHKEVEDRQNEIKYLQNLLLEIRVKASK